MSDQVQGFGPVVSAIKRMDKPARHDWMREQLAICVSKQIRDIRIDRGWTQAELGKRCGMLPSYITRLETPYGAIHATIDTLCRIAAAFDCALEVRFISWTEFVIHVLTITGSGVKVCEFKDDEMFLRGESK
jgi:transcriptional regulator with XRE-family HTH domain